jgi:translation initiation factor 4E
MEKQQYIPEPQYHDLIDPNPMEGDHEDEIPSELLEAPEPPYLVLEVPENEHAIETSWSFWFDKKPTKSSAETAENYESNLLKLGTFQSIESFWRHYAHLKRPDSLPKNCNIHMFRSDLKPMWETFPKGGCWNLKLEKNEIKDLCKMWEELLFGCIGEVFEEPDVVGVVLSIRAKENVLSVWNKDNTRDPDSRFKIGDKLKSILGLHPNTPIEYKKHSTSMKDRSTYRNGKTYLIS